MSETTESLQTFLKIIKKKGLGHYPGENVNQMATEVKTAVSSLYAIGELRRETTKDVATGLTITSVDPFKRVFEEYESETTSRFMILAILHLFRLTLP